jgi:exosortase/archaeosortase family protein
VLGVNEACSGVRSLQAALMAAFFLGEFYRLKTGARVALVLAGFLSALVTNIGRTTFLSFSAARGGVDAVANWHDPAGYTVLTICLVMLTLVALWLRRKHSGRDVMPTAIPAHLPPARAGFILAGWMALVVAGAEIWYYQPPRPDAATWTMTMPDGTSEQPLPKTTLELLSCDHYRATNWRDESGWHWAILFMQWEPSSDHAVLRSRMHRPEICMPATGLVEAGPHRTLIVPVAGFELAFESMHFRSPDGQDAYIFYCPWEIIPGESGFNAPASDATRLSCLLRVWQRERVLGRQVAEVMITDAPSREAAEAAVQKQLGALIRRVVPES